MYIKCVQIQNFRKLKVAQIDLAPTQTVFVGSNNSGKTSAIAALNKFLGSKNKFSLFDLTITHFSKINEIGAVWETDENHDLLLDKWYSILPALDVWLNVPVEQVHYVSHLIPSLDWAGGDLGVRLRLEAGDFNELKAGFIRERISAKTAVGSDTSVELWPTNLIDFLKRNFSKFFKIKAYILNPEKYAHLITDECTPQELALDFVEIEGKPFDGIIKLNEIQAQKGFSDLNDNQTNNVTSSSKNHSKTMLSEQLAQYYKKHLDPFNEPKEEDLAAIKAIIQAQNVFEDGLSRKFVSAFDELKSLGYPNGLTDANLVLKTNLDPEHILQHTSILEFDAFPPDSGGDSFRLPENYNGLGYQNLISMIFLLMSFRDGWMRDGKPDADLLGQEVEIEPIHLVLIEEPEAHLHVQVQQMFIKKAYEVLNNHKDLKGNGNLTTQLVISTHSSNIAHELNYESLRYFKRHPACFDAAGTLKQLPITTVVNLSQVFGNDEQTKKFVKRYLKVTHSDLFFADAAIMVEGAAERILLPYLLGKDASLNKLSRSHISILEVGGSHAKTLKPLIEHLGLTALIVTDIDAKSDEGKKCRPELGKNQVSGNSTITEILNIKSLDSLVGLSIEDKVKNSNSALIGLAYQLQIPNKNIARGEGIDTNIIPSTFEDALFLENLLFFKNLSDPIGFAKILKDIANENLSVNDLAVKAYEKISSAEKAAFAVNLLFDDKDEVLNLPSYIRDGLFWLQEKLSPIFHSEDLEFVDE